MLVSPIQTSRSVLPSSQSTSFFLNNPLLIVHLFSSQACIFAAFSWCNPTAWFRLERSTGFSSLRASTLLLRPQIIRVAWLWRHISFHLCIIGKLPIVGSFILRSFLSLNCFEFCVIVFDLVLSFSISLSCSNLNVFSLHQIESFQHFNYQRLIDFIRCCTKLHIWILPSWKRM